MKLTVELIEWIKSKVEEISQNHGWGYVSVTLFVKNGVLDGMERKAVQTDKYFE